MKVALITDGIWPYVLGGMQKHSYYLAKYLARKGVHVELFHFNRSNYDISALEFFSTEEKKFIHASVVDFPQLPPFPGHYIYASRLHSKRIYKLISQRLGDFDFIYTKGFTGWELISKKAAASINCCPIGVKFHGYEMFQPAPGIKIWLQNLLLLRKPVKFITRNADLVFSYGGKITGIIRSLGVPDARIFELPSGVESDTVVTGIRKTNAKIRFLYLGRYERRKGIEELNAAIMGLSAAELEKAEFHFVGPIPDNKRLGNNTVHYHGEIRDPGILQNLISSQDVLLCPSWSEGMPNSILEAMSKGLCVIASNVGANSILVSPETGWLIESVSPAAVETAIREVLNTQKEVIDRKKSAALKLIREKFIWEKLIDKLHLRLSAISSVSD